MAALLCAVGCGGRTGEEPDDGSDPSGGGGQTTGTPVPTCGQICRRAVDTCFPGGVTDQCVKDCEAARTEYMGCKGLDKFLACRLSTRILCTEKVTFDGCYDELNELVRCKS